MLSVESDENMSRDHFTPIFIQRIIYGGVCQSCQDQRRSSALPEAEYSPPLRRPST